MGAATGFLIIIFTAFSFHVIMFGIEVILSLIITLQIIYEYVTEKEFFRIESRKFMNYIAVTYASAHFFLTATTVMALTFFPEFLVFAGQLLFYPLGFIIAVLILRLLMISYFWYGWDRFSKKSHMIAGIVFSISGVLWVYLYTVLLATMNYSPAIQQINPLMVNHCYLFLNPTIIPLLLTIVFGAIAATTSFLVFYYGRTIVNRKTIVQPDSRYQYKLFQIYNYAGFASLIGLILSFLWYLLSLRRYSPYKYSNILGKFFGMEPASLDLGWLFLIMLILILAVVILWGRAVYLVYTCEFHDELITHQNKWRYLSFGPLMAIIFEIFIIINFLSQSPYFFISPFNEQEVGMMVEGALNEYANIIDMYSLTIFGFGPLLIAFGTLLYFFFTGKMQVYNE